MIACSAAWSTSVTKSLCPFSVTLMRSRSNEARLMIVAARRAALTAVLSMGCIEVPLKWRCPLLAPEPQ